MPLTGLEIYKLLPQTNCKECGFPTCLAFAMKLAAKQASLKQCPHVTEAAQAKLEAASAPPIRLITLGAGDSRLEVGNETVLFRHDKTFYHRPGVFVRLRAALGPAPVLRAIAEADAYSVDYVGIHLSLDGFALDAGDAAPEAFAEVVGAARAATSRPFILIAAEPAVLAAGAQAAGSAALLYAADESNWEAMAPVAHQAKAPLAVRAAGLEALATLTEALKKAGVEDLVLDPLAREPGASLTLLTQLRRLAIQKSFRALGYPVITFPGEAPQADAGLLAAQHIAKYAGFIVLERFDPAELYPLLVLRQNIYTDPQKPIQVQPGLYEINSPTADSPVMVTTNFSITYFAVNNEVEGSGLPGWLIVADAEGMSVLTAWAAGKFDADRIAKAVNSCGIAERISHRRLILPGQVAVLSGEVEESLPGWEIMVGPKEAVDLPSFLKLVWGQPAR
jgi:acetyl-CoA decarbonylase/synthase, CODH/ACS complex subunit gamma